MYCNCAVHRNLAVEFQKLYDSNEHWKKKYGYHQRSLSEIAMFQMKKLLGGALSLRNYNAQYAIDKSVKQAHRTRYARNDGYRLKISHIRRVFN